MYPTFTQQHVQNYNNFPIHRPMIPPSYYYPFPYLYPPISTPTNDHQALHNFQKLKTEKYEEFLLSQLSHSLQNQNFTEIYRIMENNSFSEKHHQYLQELWFTSHYEEAKTIKKLKLTPVTKYRIRKKYPPPSTIWDGEETSYYFKETSRKLLKEAFLKSPYPTASEKKMLAEKTELNKEQICNWFKNRRQRNRNSRLKSSVTMKENEMKNHKSEASHSVSDSEQSKSEISNTEQSYSKQDFNLNGFHVKSNSPIDNLYHHHYPYSTFSQQLMDWTKYNNDVQNYSNSFSLIPQNYFNPYH